MNTDDIAEIIATTTTTLLLAALLVWLVVTLPLWSVPIVFALAAFFAWRCWDRWLLSVLTVLPGYSQRLNG
jgi:hypothetical protein